MKNINQESYLQQQKKLYYKWYWKQATEQYQNTQLEGWKFRLKNEMENSKTCYLVTIKSNQLNLGKSDFQKYMKRLRKASNTPLIKYYCRCYLGQNNEIANYQMLIFNVQKKYIKTSWPLVTMTFKKATIQAINKTLHQEQNTSTYNLISKGLGSKYLSQIPDEIKQKGVSVLKLHHRYYRVKSGIQLRSTNKRSH